MDLNRFIGLCGGSLFPEEYRGDLDASWDQLQQAQPDVLSVEPAVHAEYLECLSIYSILTGRLAETYKSLDVLYGLLDRLPQEWGLRHTNYMLLADWTRRYPPLLRFFHEYGRPVEMAMVSDIIGPHELSHKFLDGFLKYFPLGSIRDRALCHILAVVQSFPSNSRLITMCFHPLFSSAFVPEFNADPALSITEWTKNLLKLLEMAEASGAAGITLYLTRLLVERHLACQSPTSAVALGDLYAMYEKMADQVGMANCKMMEGDNLLSPAFASPLSLNLIVLEVSSPIAEDSNWDRVESDLEFIYSPQVQQCYETALKLFQNADCRRGQAAVLLRRGCSLHTVARQLQPTDKRYMDTLKEAEKQLQESLELFGKDEANVQIAKAHQIMVGISIGYLHHGKEAAKGIGLWSINAKNESVAHFIGLLLSRFARQEWYKFSRMDRALLAWECAYEVFETLGDMITMLQTVVSRAGIHHDMYNPAAGILMKKALSMVKSVMGYYDTKIRSVPDTSMGKIDQGMLLTSKFGTLLALSNRMRSICMRMGDLQLFNEWQTRFVYWQQNDDSFRYLREKSGQSNVPGLDKKMEDFWRSTLVEDAIFARYASSSTAHQRYLEEGDVVKAEETLRRFVDEAEHLDQTYGRDLYRMIACDRIGDLSKARAILDTMGDNELFQGDLHEFLQGNLVHLTFPDVADNALTFAVIGGDLERAYGLLDLITKISPRFFECVDQSALDYSFRLAHYGAIMMKNQHPELAFSKLLQARRMIEVRRAQTADVDARIGSFTAGWTCEVFLDLVRICLSCSNSEIPLTLVTQYDHGHPENISWDEHALMFVEEGRARAVLESLLIQGRMVDIRTDALSEAIYKRRTLRALLSRKSERQEQTNEALQLEQTNEVLQLEHDIKELEGGDDLSPAATFIEAVNSAIEPRLLYQSIDETAVVIEASFGPRGSVAFAVTRDGIQQVHQGPARMVDIRRPVMKVMKMLGEMTGYLTEEEGNRKQMLNELLREISAMLLLPFAEMIRAKTHIIFSTSHPLTAFPFSMLIFDDKPLVMHAAVSQVPSLTVLYHLSQRKSATGTPTVSVFAKAPTEKSSDFATSNRERNLHMAGIEAINIARMFSTWPIEASHLSRKDFREYLQGESLIMHIGLHGENKPGNPLLSSIKIGQGQDFRVLDMSVIRGNARLLVFAACFSGLGKATIGSEVLGFSHVVMSSGCQAYIGTLRAVSDFASMFFMMFFYRILKTKAHMSVAEAIREAQLEFLQLDSHKASLLLDELFDNCTSTNQEGHNPAEFVPNAELLRMISKMILKQLDWSSPYYWAPFTLMGYGDFRFLPKEV